MISASFNISPNIGVTQATEFTFVDTSSLASDVIRRVWSFDDNSAPVYNKKTTTHIYQAPGTYNVTLKVTGKDGTVSTFVNSVLVNSLYKDYVQLVHIPGKYADPGKKTDTPFKVNIISTQIDKPIILNLYAANSKSIPYNFVPSRWSFLNPTWKFTDVNDTVVTSLSVESTPLYSNNKVVALSGEAEFYFIDSTSTGAPQENCPVLISCVMETSGFINYKESKIYPYDSHANNKDVRSTAVWLVNDLQPDLLKVSSNYITDMNNQYWQGIKIPFLVTAHSNRSYKLPGALSSESDIIFTYPLDNTTGLISQVSATLTTLPSTAYSLDEAPLYFQQQDKNEFRTGGYIFTTVTSNSSISNTNITANTYIHSSDAVINENEFPYVGTLAPNPFVCISNPEQNTLNKITLVPYPNNCPDVNYFKEQKTLIDGTVKEITVPAYSQDTKINYTMQGFSGIYGIAIDPREYNIIACDAELDRIYKFDYTGSLLLTYELSSVDVDLGSLNNDNAYQKALFNWSIPITTNSITLNSYYLDRSISLSENENNYIVSIGGVIQPPGTYNINIADRTLSFTTQPTLSVAGSLLNVVQIFNPALPLKYISSLQSFTETPSSTTTTLELSGQLSGSLLTDSAYYIVSLDGIFQEPGSYTIDAPTKSITFQSGIPANTTTQVLYISSINPPASWSLTPTTSISTIPLTGDSRYNAKKETDFIVNIGGVFQSTENYTYDFINNQIIFETNLPVGIPATVTQIDINESIYVPAAYTPAYASIDKDYNIWVSLYNTVSVLKFDENFNLLYSTQPSGFEINQEYQQEFILKPPVVETDRDSNCWATYSRPLCSLLVKYSSTGQVLSQIELEDNSVPNDIAIDINNNVWVSKTYNTLSADGSIQLFNGSNSSLLSSISGIPRPGYLALDKENNLWFTHSINGLGYYNTTTSTLCTWSVNGNSILSAKPLENFRLSPDTYINDESLGGLGVDVYNRVWVIDSLNNTAKVILSATPLFDPTTPRDIKIKPVSTFGYYLDLDTGDTITESVSSYLYKSAQAAGDWTGNKWYQKYILPSSFETKAVSGISTNFNIKELTNENSIRKVNESFDTAEYYKSLALPEVLKDNTVLWDKFFAAAVGTGKSSTQADLGQVTYERTANFLSSHADIDTCDIDQLLNLAQETGTPAANYSIELPAEIKRMLDISSIPRDRLWGIQDRTVKLSESQGLLLNTEMATITAGDKLLLRSKFDGGYSLVSVPLYNSLTAYPLSSFEGIGYVQPVTTNYLFYTYEPTYTGKYIENVIDWASEYTTLNPNLSTFEDWYGEDGVLENTFNYLLTKNLFLK